MGGPPSRHAGDDALEVFTLEAAGADGVIGGGAAAFEHRDLATASLGHRGEHLEEVVARDAPRAGTGDEDPPRLEEIDADAVDTVVGAEGFFNGAAAAGELRRIEDHHPELLAGGGQAVDPPEGVSRLHRDVCRAVEVGVGPGERRRLGAAVDGEHAAGRAGDGAGDGEAAGVAEEIEDTAVAGQERGGTPILTLVEVEAGLLPLRQIDAPGEVALTDEDRPFRRCLYDYPVG